MAPPAPFKVSALGTVSYNGVTFNPYIKSSVDAKPVFDDADRTVKYVRYTFSIAGWVSDWAQSPPTSNAVLADLRQKLTARGKEFHFDNHGIGATFTVNKPGGTVLDVKWGPVPEVLAMSDIIGGTAVYIEWKCVVCLPECPGSVFEKKVMAFCYDVDYQIGSDGLQTIVTSGSLEIPLTYHGNNTLTDSADAYRELIPGNVPGNVPAGFQRTQDYRLSKDRTRLEFTITDKQNPVAYPPFVTKISMRYRYANNTPMVFTQWTITISGTVTVAPNVPKAYAWDAFLVVAGGRIGLISNALQAQNAISQLLGGQASLQLFPIRFSADEEVYDLTTSFELTVGLAGLTLFNALAASGLWLPVNTDWKQWRDSLKDSAHHPRGVLKVKYVPDNDAIIDLCDAGDPLPVDPGQASVDPKTMPPDPTQPPPPGPQPPPPPKPRTFNDIFDPTDPVYPPVPIPNPPPPVPFPAATWIKYVSGVKKYQKNHILIHKPLKGNITLTNPTRNPQNLPDLANPTGVGGAKITTDTPDILQRMVSPTTRLVLSGWAMRIGLPISAPDLDTYANQKVTEEESYVSDQKVIGWLGSYPVIYCEWEKVYIAPMPIDPNMPVLANPMQGTQGGSLFQPDNGAGS